MIEAGEKLLRTDEVAAELGVTVRQVQLLIKQERLKAEKQGRDWFVKAGDLAEVRERPKGRPIGAKDSKPRKATAKKKKTAE